MKLIAVDLELTQVAERQSQIIQIGACVINTKTYEIEKKFVQICKPSDSKDRVEGLGLAQNGITTITELTGISSEQVENGMPIKEALDKWVEFVNEAKAGWRFVEWGGFDCKELARNMQRFKIGHEEYGYNRRETKIDLKAFVAVIKDMKHKQSRGGLNSAMKEFGLEFEGNEHNALADAVNTGRLFLHLLEQMNGVCFF
jgi:inhibitor of KinA sporulation pathway (predicted exonuclease)